MSRIQIPLDILTSRLNLADRFAGVRSQSLAARFANFRPFSEFLDLKRLSKPANFGEIQSRVNYNLGYFSSNYAVVFILLSLYSLLTHWLLLFFIVLVVGGMWSIGKLQGEDLDIAGFRATSSQLYTGLLIVVVPIGIIVSFTIFSAIFWVIGASFFRGGGLGSRPRSPKSVPLWGRPPGAKGSKRRKQWEREQAAWGQSRVEELDSDDTDTQGVGLNFEKKRFASDPLQFTGIDLAPSSRARRGYAYDSGSEEESEESDEDEHTSALQVALRDKEEALVQSALARIRRAQEKGQREVKLNPEEIGALERRRKRMQSAATSKERKGSGSSSGSERRRHSDRDLVTVPIGPSEPKSRKRSKSKRAEDRYSQQPAAPPGMLIQGADGITYAPLGYYPPPAGPSHNSPTRPRSATSTQLRATPPPQFVAYQPTNRHFSEGNRPLSSTSTSSRRPLPDEEGWIPEHSRRGSVSSQIQSVDPFDYQISSEQPPLIPHQYMQAGSRRNVSGPPEVVYSSVRRTPPNGTYPAAARGAASDPILRRQGSRRDESSSEDESDDLGNGVQVFVEEPERERERPVPRKPVGSKKRGKR